MGQIKDKRCLGRQTKSWGSSEEGKATPAGIVTPFGRQALGKVGLRISI